MSTKITLLIALLASLWSSQLTAQTNEFSFELEIDRGAFTMNSIQGTAWETLTTYNPFSKSHFVNNTGTYTSQPDDDATFLLKLTLKNEVMVITSSLGTSWDDYVLDCPDNSCRFLVNDKEVRTLSKDETVKVSQKISKKIKALEAQREEVENREKAKLKAAIAKISNDETLQQDLSPASIDSLKMALAEQTAQNIENQIAIIDNSIAYIERNKEDVGVDLGKDGKDGKDGTSEFNINLGGLRLLSITEKNDDATTVKIEKPKALKERNMPYSSRTHSDITIGISFNNAVLDGGSIEDTQFKFGGSRSFEMGYEWSTRVFKETNFLRLNYGVALQFNGLKPKDNQIFIQDGEQTELKTFEFDLDKSKFRMDNLIIPIHLQFGSSKTTVLDNGNKRFSDHHFKIGIGGFAGINLSNTQKLKFDDGRRNEKLKQRDDFNTNNLLYGLSTYFGWDDFAVFAQYNLNSIFTDNVRDLNNFQLGVRWHL